MPTGFSPLETGCRMSSVLTNFWAARLALASDRYVPGKE
jgi:hypothetical protein